MAAPGTPANLVPPGEDAVIRRIQELERTIRELAPSIARSFEPVIADLQAQQATLGAQQADLTAAVNDISTLSANQVTGDVANNYVLTPVTSAWVNYAPLSITVPTGYTRAQVMAVSSIIGPTTDTWQMRVDIAGTTSAAYTVFGNNGALGFARNLTGLTGGSTISVATGVQNAVASGNNRGIATSATVVFLK